MRAFATERSLNRALRQLAPPARPRVFHRPAQRAAPGPAWGEVLPCPSTTNLLPQDLAELSAAVELALRAPRPVAATLKLSDATPLELPRGLKAALLSSGLFGVLPRSPSRWRALAASLSSSLFSTSSEEAEDEEAEESSGGVLLHGAPLPGCTLLVLDGFAPPTPAHGGGGGGAPSGGEGGGVSAASALASLLAGSSETARFLRAQRRVTLTAAGSRPASAAFGVLEAAQAGGCDTGAPPPRLPPLSPLAARTGVSVALRAVGQAGSACAGRSTRARISGCV